MGTKKQSQGNTFTSLVELTAKQVQRLVKPREGFIAFAEPLIALYEANLDDLRLADTQPATLRAQLQAYQTLLERESDLDRELTLVRETRAVRAADVWTAMLDIYARARSAGRRNGTIKHAVAAFAQFLKRSPRKAASPTTPATPAA